MKVNSNWLKLKKKVETDVNKSKSYKQSKYNLSSNKPSNEINDSAENLPEGLKSLKYVHESISSKYVALDCEMVGIGEKGKQNALARCCLVNFDGDKIYDEFVRPPAFVTDFRTRWSGVRREDLRAGSAVELNEVRYFYQ